MNQTAFQEKIKTIPYITKQNLGLLLGKKEESLNYWVKKMVKEGTLILIKKGLYIPRYYYDIVSAVGLNEKEQYLVYLANSIRQPSYISLEYVLSKQGFLPETAFAITSITLKSTRSYATDVGTFYYQNIKRDLFFGYKIQKFKDKQIREASLAKALFDLLYLRSFTNALEMKEYLLSTGRLNWGVMSQGQKIEFTDIIRLSQSKKMQSILSILKDSNIL